MSDWKAKRRAAGWADKLVWLTPDAVAALAVLKPIFPGESEGDIFSRALVCMAEHAEALHTTAAPSVEERLQRLEHPYRVDAIAIMKERLNVLEGEIAALKAGCGEVKSRNSGAGSVQLKDGGKRVSHWQEELVDYTAHRMLRDGTHFNLSRCWQDMQQDGIEAHAQRSGLYTWLSNPHNMAEVEARMRELEAEASESPGK